MLRAFILTTLLLVTGCASLPVDYERTDSHALQDTGDTRLGQAGRAALQAHPGEDAFRPLLGGVDALLARIHLADAAERSLDLMYYIWRNDVVGRRLAEALLRAADRGVRVRVLLDDVGANPDDNNLMALDAHPNIEIRLFNPIASRGTRMLGALADFGRVNRRMHNKAFIADNQRAILGGRNIGDEYFDAAQEGGSFGDLDVLTAGPVVAQVSAAFDLFWNAPVVYPIRALTGKRADPASLDALRTQLDAAVEAQRNGPYAENARSRAAEVLDGGWDSVFWGRGHVLFDDPSKVTRSREIVDGNLVPQLAALGLPLKRELMIASAYFVPGDAGVAWLAGLVKRGVRVSVLTNSLASNDVTATHAGYQRYRERLVDEGVKLYELRPDFDATPGKGHGRRIGSSHAALHAKTFFFDREAVFIGSLNLDPRSIQLNTEIGIVCESPPMAESMLRDLEGRLDRMAWRIERVADDSATSHIVWVETNETGVVQRTEEPDVSVWKRLSAWFFGVLPIESQL